MRAAVMATEREAAFANFAGYIFYVCVRACNVYMGFGITF